MGPLRIVSRPQGIPWTALQMWCDRARCDDDEREFITGLVLAMDRAFLSWRGDKIAKELKAMVK